MVYSVGAAVIFHVYLAFTVRAEDYCKVRHNCDDKEMTSQSALAVVPYTEDNLMPHHRPQRDFHLAGHPISIQQDWGGLGIAAVVWDAAVVLGEYLEKHREIVDGRRVLELGAGTGLLGIVAAFLGGEVTVTERQEVLPNLRKIVQTNTEHVTPCSITVSELDWRSDLTSYTDRYDVILGADVIYIEETFDDLLRTLITLTEDDTLVLLSCRIRYDRDLRFLSLLDDQFKVEEIVYDRSRDIKIFSAVKKLKH